MSMTITELLNELPSQRIEGVSLGGPYVGLSHNEITRAILAKGREVVPALVKRLEGSGLTETIFLVFLLRELQAKEARAAVMSLLHSPRFRDLPRDLTLEMQIRFFLRDVDSW